MTATSAYRDFCPRLVEAFESLQDSHHSKIFAPNCPGCQLAAESALQNAFRAWEWFIKEVIIDLMYSAPTAHRLPGHAASRSKYSTRHEARTDLLRTKYNGTLTQRPITLKARPGNYLLLHSPDMVAAVAEYWIPNSDLERVFRTNNVDIERILKIRHGLAHGTRHAQVESRQALLTYEPSKRFTSIGEFLLFSSQINSPPWIERLLDELVGYATQISP
jgi:hypothetical protein